MATRKVHLMQLTLLVQISMVSMHSITRGNPHKHLWTFIAGLQANFAAGSMFALVPPVALKPLFHLLEVTTFVSLDIVRDILT